MVEYILVLAMMALIGISIFKSEKFKGIFGEDSALFEKLRNKIRYEYRHGLSGEIDTTNNSYGGVHETYFKKGRTRFFIPDAPYPE